MSVLSRFEAMMQGIVEGSFGHVFRARLQPVELSGKLTRAMEDNLQIGPDRRLAPNRYDVYLSQRDFADLSPMAESLKMQCANQLIAIARDRGYTLTTRPTIVLHEDAQLVTGQIHIDTQVLDARAAPNRNGDGMDDEDTRSMSPAEAQELAREISRAQAEASPVPPAWLTLYRPVRGKPMQLTKPVIHIGRHLSNEIVVNDKRVSRYHAEIRYEHGQFVLYDLGSTNGVGINGVLTRQPVPLKNNDLISVGSHDFVFQRR